MTLVAGLGNIGKAYENTRHNIGFMLVDKLIDNSHFLNNNFLGNLYKKDGVLFLKPSTLMNTSGSSIEAVYRYYKCKRLIVIHDDIELKLGALRFKKGGGSGGHNGLKSIDAELGCEYERIRVGISKDIDVAKHVLTAFKADEKELITKVLEQAKKALEELIIKDDLQNISQRFTLRA